MSVDSCLGLSDERGSGCISFPAALSSARALFTVMNNYYMAHFCACRILTFIYFSVDNDTAADTGTESDHNCVLITLSSAGENFAEGSYVCIVTDINGLIYVLLKNSLHGNVTAVCKVVCILKNAVFSIEGSGRTDTDALNLVERNVILFEKRKSAVSHILDYLFERTFCHGLYRFFRDDLTLVSYDTDSDISTAEVITNIIHLEFLQYISYFIHHIFYFQRAYL